MLSLMMGLATDSFAWLKAANGAAALLQAYQHELALEQPPTWIVTAGTATLVVGPCDRAELEHTCEKLGLRLQDTPAPA